MTLLNEDLAWFRLFRTRGLGPKRLHALHRDVSAAGLTIDRVFTSDRLTGLEPKVIEHIRRSDNMLTDTEFTRLVEQEVTIVHLSSGNYPDLLRQRMGDIAPPLLFCRGYAALLSAPSIAIVGSRAASPFGLTAATRIAGELALVGMNVISGYAGGVDSHAHLGALEKDGATTMVLSTGILHFSRKRIYSDVHWDGNVLAVSQFQPHERWNARNAMIRNKLVCALSQGVVVIESGTHRPAKMSGTFDAALTALAMGVPLFVLDPSLVADSATGNSELIRRGASRITPDEAVTIILKHPLVRCSEPAPTPAEQAGHQLPLL